MQKNLGSDLLNAEALLKNSEMKYSVLPTLLWLVGPLEDRVVADLGFGGVFALHLAAKAKKVYSFGKPSATTYPNTFQHRLKFLTENPLSADLPEANVVCLPLMLAIVDSFEDMLNLFKRVYSSLSWQGKLVGVVNICEGDAVFPFLSKQGVESSLREAGFADIIWHFPIVTKQGQKELGVAFWDAYLGNLTLSYFTARKL